MAYGTGDYPTELANKVGHVKLIEDPLIQRLVEAFEDIQPVTAAELPEITGRIDLSTEGPIQQVITVDGGHQAVPNIVRPDRQVGFVQVAVQMVKKETIEYLRQNPMADPRDVQRILGAYTHHILAALPIVGVHVAGLTLKESIREYVHRFLAHYELYPALAFLVYRQWQSELQDAPSMDCLQCGSRFNLPRNKLDYECSQCGHRHRLSDYLGLSDNDAEDRSTGETVSSLRSALEVLALFSLIVRFREQNAIMSRTLFVLDGPLLLRAQLSRLVEPIRAFLQHYRDIEKPVYLVGVEKSGEFRDFADSYSSSLSEEGDYFIPGTRFVVEDINGRTFDPDNYRNRVNYGEKVIARLGPHHVLALNIPTGRFTVEPTFDELIGFEDIARCLAGLLSYRYTNALIPVILANTSASISNRPSGGILAQFVEQVMHGQR